MNPLIDVEVNLHFEVKDSETFGGIGSVGYFFIGLSDMANNIDLITDDSIAEDIKKVAKLMSVSSECVRLISKNEYDEETGDNDEPEEYDDDGDDDWDE